jgi:hypothetical protein
MLNFESLSGQMRPNPAAVAAASSWARGGGNADAEGRPKARAHALMRGRIGPVGAPLVGSLAEGRHKAYPYVSGGSAQRLLLFRATFCRRPVAPIRTFLFMV